MQLADLVLQFALEHQTALGGSAGALLASVLHAKLGGRSLAARSLSLALPGFLNTKLAKALAVDVAKAVLEAWGPAAAPVGDLPKPTEPAPVL